MGEEQKPEQVKPEEKTPEDPKPPSPFVLSLDLHCVGCAKKIEKSLFGIRGVVGVEMDMVKNEVTIKGVVEPEAVCNKIMKKTKRSAKILSPVPAAEGEPMVASQVPGLNTVELNVNMHCEACALQLKRKILKMKGVRTVETELSSGKVMVTGTMDGKKLVAYVYRRTKKQAKIVPQPEPEPKPAADPEAEKPKEEENKAGGEEAKAEEKPPEEDKKEGDGDGGGAEEKGDEKKEDVGDEATGGSMQRMMYYYEPLYVIERIPPPQLFSDENPNACSIC